MKQTSLFLILTTFPILSQAAIPMPALNNNEIVINNLTLKQLRKNPSNIYTISAQINPMCADIFKDSIKTSIVIDGQSHPMIKDPTKPNSYSYDFKMPACDNVARYYFSVDYITTVFESKKERTYKSPLYDLQIMNRYPSTLDVNRGLIGSVINISGRGFLEGDKIVFGDIDAETYYVSDFLINFRVPSLPAGRTYEVALHGNHGLIPIGEFKIDFASLCSDHDSLSLKSHESKTVAFEIEKPAPAGGLELDISTNIPESIIMPEVFVPAGSKRVTAVIQAGRAGEGQLYIAAEGFKELVIPVAVTGEKNFWRY